MARAVIDEMKVLNLDLRIGHYNALLYKSSDYETSRNIIKEIHISGLSLNDNTYIILVDKANSDDEFYCLLE